MRNLLIILVCIGIVGCKVAPTVPNATGTIYECLCVIDAKPLHNVADSINAVIRSNPYAEDIHTTADWVKATLESDMPCLPQMESYLTVSVVKPSQFDNFLKPTRNVLYVDIDSVHHSTLKVKYIIDHWSHPQAVCRITANNNEQFIAFWKDNGERIRDWFVLQELNRQANFYKAYRNKEACELVKKEFGLEICIPEDYTILKDTTVYLRDFSINYDDVRVFWACDPKGNVRKDIVIYSYPYIAQDNFTVDFLCKRRDEVLSQIITASTSGSYMGTEYKHIEPQMKAMAGLDGQYVAELRGLWKIYNGEAMGGPFVSHTQVDTVSQRVLTTEVFLYASGQKKRNSLRKAEAILYTQHWAKERAE